MKRIPIEVPAATVKIGSKLLLEAPAMGGAGYAWSLVESSRNVRVTEVFDDETTNESASDEPLVGGPCIQKFLVEGLVAGACELRFSYGRFWEDRPEREHVLAIRVTA